METMSLDSCGPSDQMSVADFEKLFGRRNGKRSFPSYDQYMDVYKKAACTAKSKGFHTTLRKIATGSRGSSVMALELGCECSVPDEPVLHFAGQHAREWVAIGVCFGTMVHAANNPVNPNCRCRVYSCLTNSDGYKITRTTNRMQRKSALEVDMNRNWTTNWENGVGCSKQRNGENYRGPKPLSEPETLGAHTYLMDVKKRCGTFSSALDIHGDAGAQIIAWGTKKPPKSELDYHFSTAKQMNAVMEVHGGDFEPMINYYGGPSPKCGIFSVWAFENLCDRKGMTSTYEMPLPRGLRKFRGNGSMVPTLAKDFALVNAFMCDSTKYAPIGGSLKPRAPQSNPPPPSSPPSPGNGSSPPPSSPPSPGNGSSPPPSSPPSPGNGSNTGDSDQAADSSSFFTRNTALYMLGGVLGFIALLLLVVLLVKRAKGKPIKSESKKVRRREKRGVRRG